jgi:hypothetical protein
MVEKQPPGDEGSRGNLKDRKATVSSVGKGFMGIVNIYQLVPKGSAPAPVESFGIPPAAPGTKIFSQSKSKKKKEALNIEAQKQKVEKRLSLGHSDVGWKFDSSERQFRLAVKEGDTFGHFLLGVRDYSPQAAEKYETELKLHPNLVEKNIDRKKFNNAMKQLQKNEGDQEKFQRSMFQQAMNLKIHIGDLLRLYTESVQQRREEAAQREDEQIVSIGEGTSTIFRPSLTNVSEPKQKLLPGAMPGITQIALGDADMSNGFKYITPESAPFIYKSNPSVLRFTEDKGRVNYYIDMKSKVDRRKKSTKSKLQRKIVKKKIMPKKRVVPKSSTRKKILLKNLKCKCKKIRRY